MDKDQIAISKISNDDVEKAVFSALELINAARLFDKPNLKVLLKPNILGAKEPERAGARRCRRGNRTPGARRAAAAVGST